LQKKTTAAFDDKHTTMEKYESKHQQILRSAEQIYTVISRFDNLTPAVQDKVEEWRADENSCSFKVKGFTVNLQIVAKEAPKYVKIQSGEGGVPIDFTFWIQLQPAGPYDTRMRLVLHAELNMMMRMMIGGKLQKALDQIAEAMAKAMNGSAM
jgi:carbon monoxide dehydrogenase subunit G